MMNLISERKKIKQPVFKSATGEMIEPKKEKKEKHKKKCVWRPSELFGGIPIII